MAIIEVDGLRKSYAGRPVVDGVSFAVEEGEIFGVLGPNGAGKTTTVECVEGLRVPDAGRVRVAGIDPATDRARLTEVLGAQLQESHLQAKLTVREALTLYSAFYPTPADWRPLAERLGLGDRLDARFGKLSGGQKQRLFIALALVGAPKVVVLDELTTGLDPRSRRDTWKLIEEIRDTGVTVLLVTHFMEEARHLCDRIAVIRAGKVIALDTPTGLIDAAAGGTEISFVPSRPLTGDELAELAALPGAGPTRTDGEGRVSITGTDDTAAPVIALLSGRGVTPRRLRVEAGTLDDAFLDLTDEGNDDPNDRANDKANDKAKEVTR
ncbi:ABC transporter ATP-binding protein [Spongiactinospora sp. TRM90649]|uniref:ABC transporter ATP-binding protein n=1 Tax=Spongiactinospora sp. TRM90649 TaxID=3031114 RepID=UPI0023F750DD|nr:ABC transporter ATP-binding protein [Spongiactinospora sp. TRM90649]MDF5757018.1 ABC transporter ATP-binding protein [Spongiactinospora sp. TRM90649]